jgi:hypothetical protein
MKRDHKLLVMRLNKVSTTKPRAGMTCDGAKARANVHPGRTRRRKADGSEEYVPERQVLHDPPDPWDARLEEFAGQTEEGGAAVAFWSNYCYQR